MNTSFGFDTQELHAKLLTPDEEQRILRELEESGIARDVVRPLVAMMMSVYTSRELFDAAVASTPWGENLVRYLLHVAADCFFNAAPLLPEGQQ